MENELSNEMALTVQGVQSEPIQYIDLFIPIYRFRDSNFWSSVGVYATREEAIAAVRNMGCADAKILTHSERFVKFDSI